MKKTVWPFALFYYLLVPCVYLGGFESVVLLFRSSKHADNLVDAVVVSFILVLFFLPVLTAVMMRLSLLKWYVDPFAAAELPLFLYGLSLHGNLKQTDNWLTAVQLTNAALCDDGRLEWLVLVGTFLFGLAFSLSFARTRGESIGYRLLSKIIK